MLLCRDIELACDEKVIRQMDLDGKKQYSTALLQCSTGRRLVTICPLAFGEVGVKERVKNVLNYKKPAFWVVALAVIACALVSVCFATNPLEHKQKSFLMDFADAAVRTEAVTAGYLTIQDSYGDGDYTQMQLSGAVLSEYLRSTDWTPLRLPSLGSEKISVLRFTVYEARSLSLCLGKGLAAVQCGGKTEYYKLESGDFERAKTLLSEYAIGE